MEGFAERFPHKSADVQVASHRRIIRPLQAAAGATKQAPRQTTQERHSLPIGNLSVITGSLSLCYECAKESKRYFADPATGTGKPLRIQHNACPIVPTSFTGPGRLPAARSFTQFHLQRSLNTCTKAGFGTQILRIKAENHQSAPGHWPRVP